MLQSLAGRQRWTAHNEEKMTMHRKVRLAQKDHAMMKAAAVRNHERCQDVQARAVARLVAKYAVERDHLLTAVAGVEISRPVWQGWFVPAETWSAFTELRTWAELTTGVMLHEAVGLMQGSVTV